MSPPSPTPPADILGLVLAGGASRRMGADKRTLALAGRPLLTHVVSRLAPQVAALAVALDRETSAHLVAGEAPALVAALPTGATVLSDAQDTREGPLAGVLAGLRWAAACGAGRLVTVPVDTPLLPADLVARLAAAVAGDEIAVAATAGRVHHTVALLPPGLADDLAEYLAGDDRRVRGWLARHALRTVEIPPLVLAGHSLDPLQNLNTPADLAAAEAALSSLMTPP